MKSICTFIQNASWVFLTKKAFWIDQGKMDSDSTHEKPPHWSPEEGLRLCISWLVGKGLGRGQRGCGQGWSVFALVERGTSRMSCTLWEAIWPLCVCANAAERPSGCWGEAWQQGCWHACCACLWHWWQSSLGHIPHLSLPRTSVLHPSLICL